MKVSGFSFIKNAVKFDFPIIEAITSILPVCDEFIIAVGKSDDATLELIQNIGSPKIKIIETVWNEALREGGHVLSDETNKALTHVAQDADWCFYVQGDEVFHEQDLDKIKAAMLKWKDNKKVEGLVFNHLNFYGSYDYLADARHWQKKEVRVIRNDKAVSSYKDAMSFRKEGRKLNCKFVDATIYHYGWVKDPKIQIQKRKEFEKLWHDDKFIDANYSDKNIFDYSVIDSVEKFKGSHPNVIKARVEKANWTFDFDPTISPKLPLRRRILNAIYQKTGLHIGEFKNYNLI
jgi:hypothetical protein